MNALTSDTQASSVRACLSARSDTPASAPTIGLLSAGAGAGKTYAASGYAAGLADAGQWVLIVQPSKMLIADTLGQLDERYPHIKATAIHSDTVADGTSVSGAIMRHCKQMRAGAGEVLLVTHAGFERTTWLSRPRWTVIYDEIPTVHWSREFCLDEHRDLLLDLIEDGGSNAAYTHLIGREGLNLRDLAANSSGDEVRALFAPLAGKLDSLHWRLYAQTEQLAKFRSGEISRPTVCGLMMPSIFAGFAEVTLMGAHAEQSILYRHWLAEGAEFRSAPFEPSRGAHANGHLLDVYYLTERMWSKTLRNTRLADGAAMDVYMVDAARSIFGRAEWCYMANKDRPDTVDAIRLPNTAHGLNRYAHIHNVVVMSALNPTPVHARFVRDMIGVSADELQDSIYRSSAYQAITRISLRDPSSAERKTAVLADRSSAEWLAEVFGAEPPRLHGTDPFAAAGTAGRRRVHRTEADRLVQSRLGRRTDLSSRQQVIRNHISTRRCTEIPITPLGDKRTPDEQQVFPFPGALGPRYVRERDEFHAQTMARLYALMTGTGPEPMRTIDPAVSRPVLHVGTVFQALTRDGPVLLDGISFESLVDWFGELQSRTVPKHEGGQISPAQYADAAGTDTRFGDANVVCTGWIGLDNDGGGIGIDEFAGLFPHLAMVMYSTHHSTSDAPRWRVLIPVDEMCDKQVYREITRQIIKRLRDRKWFPETYFADRPEARGMKACSGFDDKKLHAASLFDLPAQAAAGAEHTFLRVFAGPERRSLCVMNWIKGSIMADQPLDPRAYGDPNDRDFTEAEWAELDAAADEAEEYIVYERIMARIAAEMAVR